MIRLNCLICGQEFESANRKKGRQKFCSRECYHESLKGPRLKPKTCKGCGKDFIPVRSERKFCSRECLLDYRAKQRIIQCHNCEKVFKRSAISNKFCSNKCRGEHYSGDRNPFFKGYLQTDELGYIRFSSSHPKYPNKRLHQVIWKVNSNIKNCEVCNKEIEVIHHIDGDKTNNNIENLQPLCSSCHGTIHQKEKNILKSDT